ncbi:FliA/WhiG family RNA polymerase sigma factor [Thermomicrobiaceae bacterium CFH 74404]|uniref:FliA/WhiG family RNA polymerase sigma factor n=1 Tax=Thermalbibacter longus TaxID=2951981 RepID=A0AA42BB40_9BACT|nr:FliA/WhiG family RNA polymerase sigma factor [Thermalbibacter longus]MCM8749325.1 FliA/WhiG family RNA polymerase sigma factor [Thermalbibacter longus]
MTAMPSTNLDQPARLWQRYTMSHDTTTREQLIQQYAPLVKYVVDRLRISLPPSLERDDLIGYGTIGLIEAIDRFDPSRGVKFESYAALRIRGAILDALRSLDIVPRGARHRARQIEQATRELFAASGRMPSEAEIAEYLGLSVQELHQAIQDVACLFLPLNNADDSHELTLEEQLADHDAPDPDDLAVQTDLADRLAAALEQLSGRDRLILSLYYYEELTMREISEILGISESRISQILTRVRLQLRTLLQERGVHSSDLTL